MLRNALRRKLVGEVRTFFNDSAKGETPVIPSDDTLLPPGAVARRVHADVTTMMVGGISALLLQMLHPSALAGVWDFSDFRADMHGRLRRTARFIAKTTFAERTEAEQAIERVKSIHARVEGVRPDGVRYEADDPHLLAWVHVAEAITFLDAWIRFAEPGMSTADQDRYFTETSHVARTLGADPVPTSRTQAEALLQSYRGELSVDSRTREVAHLVLHQKPDKIALAPVQSLLMQSAVDLLPRWAQRMHGLRPSGLLRPAVSSATFGMASTLRWAFSRSG